MTFEGGGGSEIVRQLIESGHEVVGRARPEAAEQSRRPAGARPHCGSQLARAFSATVGMSPTAYLRHIRIERMARLLITTDLSMAEEARSAAGPIPTTPAAPSTPNTV